MLPLHHIRIWWPLRDSNPKLPGYEPDTLPIELKDHVSPPHWYQQCGDFSLFLLRYPASASPCLLIADRGHSLSFLHPPQAAVASLPEPSKPTRVSVLSKDRWQRWQGLNLRLSESKSDALPLGHTSIWCKRRDSNPRPPEPKSGALPAALLLHIVGADPHPVYVECTAPHFDARAVWWCMTTPAPLRKRWRRPAESNRSTTGFTFPTIIPLPAYKLPLKKELSHPHTHVPQNANLGIFTLLFRMMIGKPNRCGACLTATLTQCGSHPNTPHTSSAVRYSFVSFFRSSSVFRTMSMSPF